MQTALRGQSEKVLSLACCQRDAGVTASVESDGACVSNVRTALRNAHWNGHSYDR